MEQSEAKQRVAALNTQLRFGRHQAALVEAYKLRTYIQLSGITSEQATDALRRAERVIVELEKKQASGIQKLIKIIVHITKLSLNPTDDSPEETLLDLFEEEKEEDHFLEEQSDENVE